MIINYSEFKEKLDKKINEDHVLYEKIIKSIIDNPKRYVGVFRLTNSRTKIIQNITQSLEIKFGDFLEEIITLYIEKTGFKNLNKNIKKFQGFPTKFYKLDQFFQKDNCVFIVEQKIRDDHDSTKKHGQIQNFFEKITAVQKNYSHSKIKACMWFIDKSFDKNKNFYKSEIEKLGKNLNVETSIFYGEDFFKHFIEYKEIWNELIENINNYKRDSKFNIEKLPDFSSDPKILNILVNLPEKYWKKLNENSPIYNEVRKTFFSNGKNLKNAKTKRGNDEKH